MKLRPALLPALAAALFAVSIAAVSSGASAQSDAPIDIVSIDADISGNSATVLGPLNACVRAEPGASVTVDLVVDAVPADRGVIGFDVTIEFDPNLLTLTAVGNEFLLGAEGSYEPFEGLSGRLPDSSGKYHIVVADIASNVPFENIESGPGVLSRLTFTARGSGVSTVAPTFNPPNEYPGLLDNQNTTIEVLSIGKASIAVGQDCTVPPAATPIIQDLPPLSEIEATPVSTPTPTPEGGTTTPGGTDGTTSPRPSRSATPGSTGTGDSGNDITPDESDGGTSAGTVVAVAALAAAGVALAGGGAWMLLRRRRGGGGDAAV